MVLPTSIQTIGDYAFPDNNILSLNLSGCTALSAIGEGAFYYNSILALDLSDCTALTSVGEDAFAQNSISALDLSTCIAITTIGESAFELNSIATLNLTGCTALTTIGDRAFYQNDLTSLGISSCTTLNSIGESAFSNNSIASLDLTGCANLRMIDINAFNNNPSLTGFDLPEITYNGTVYITWVDGDANSYTAGVDMAVNFATFYVPLVPYTITDDDVEVVDGVINSCSYSFELKNIIIPEILNGQTVIAIGDGTHSNAGVFYNKGITSVELPATLQKIGRYAFYENEILSLDLSICAGIDTIDYQAFYSNNNLSSLDLSGCSVLSSIGYQAFNNNGLTSLDLKDCTALISIGSPHFHIIPLQL